MSIEKVKNYLTKGSQVAIDGRIQTRSYDAQDGSKNRIIELEESSATVREAADAIGCMEGEIAKTLSFQLSDRVILIVLAGDVKLDNHKYKEVFHEKSKMLEASLVEEKIGHQVGGVCPFGIKENVDVYLDVSLKKYKTVYPACGNSHSAIPLSIEEIEKYSNYQEWIDLLQEWNSYGNAIKVEINRLIEENK